MMMAVRPELVAMDRIPLAKSNTTPDVAMSSAAGCIAGASIGSRSGSGVIGNPEAATRGKGRAAVRRDLHRAGGQAVQRGTVGAALGLGAGRVKQ